MSEVILSNPSSIQDEGLRQFADAVADEVILAAHKAVAHHAEPKRFLLPTDRQALEHKFVAHLRAKPLEIQKRAAERVMTSILEKKLAGLAAPEFAAARAQVGARALMLRTLGSGDLLLRKAMTPTQPTAPAPVPVSAPERLVFHLVSVKCIDETDGFLGTESGTDEIALSGAMVDAAGNTVAIPKIGVGGFGGDRATRTYDPPLLLGSVDFTKGSLPRSFNLLLTLIEVDNGDLPQLVQTIYDEVSKRVREAASKAAQGLGGSLADAVTGAIMQALDRVFKFFKDVWEDDVFPGAVTTFTFADAGASFGGAATSGPRSVDFKGHGGHYRVWYSATLERAGDAALRNKAVVYEHANFGGRSLTLGVGRHDVAKIQELGNDAVSSLKVGPGVRVILYEHAGFGGPARVYSGPVAQLSDFNDRVSSVVIEPIAVTLFQHGEYGGSAQSFPLGRHDVTSLKLGNDQASSLLVPPGFKVTLFENKGFSGRKKVFQADANYVGDDFNDIVSSLVVELA
ncbi:hypothetical protein [Nannocystis bainbridge]|uniref:Beta/gamma crystallin 'Greek key' domain-containing protein n=1 Tax=Nannocystis bainbridge TaxID=2995303 RepID=A0ABT5E5M0_9BACT|nr:hypothetical protein [Nannocystis bainbridge]MDC0721151.1 hypothetical protein [Nannocystis bainbridge]